MKWVGIDYGLARTGLAATDPEGIMAYPLTTIRLADYANRKEFLAALDAAGLTDRVDAIHLDDLSRLTMDYAGRFSVEMEYNADYDRMLQILEAGISKLESNQTGSIRLDLNPPILTLD